MHGLINRSIQCFVRDSYGVEAWQAVAAAANIGDDGFEALLRYDPAITHAILASAESHLDSPRAMILEDIGSYLVSHPNLHAPRRLLRFGGGSFVDFLFSLDELRGRVRLAVPDLEFPLLELLDHSSRAYTLLVTSQQPGFGHVLVGMLRGMADDYGALVFLEHRGRRDGVETISIDLIEVSYAQGRDFALAPTA
ncbi:hypothetical protein AIOL_001760 [Candidatus Rhodobacter oscarellae]|uniref:Heme NO-binding domain-containing protein n=1 Tax=Candidatus Rhodobacter oscarellae TaxID=1675527 RepID=A0A0J9E4R0_9RHOB|nr:heme NO-binding domain-containing protein [Candidatus Rhodobacter lobularis]KMW56804.1 hypothetical protein AIOL_001760 [Candidatus Rhodobacter lobularis]